MKRKSDTKPKFKFLTPKADQRFSFPRDIGESEDVKQMIENKNGFGWESYLRVKHEISKNNIVHVQVYSSFFARLFSFAFFDLFELKTKKLNKVWLRPFWFQYRDAYFQGRKYFQETFAISSDTLYGKNGSILERTLHAHFYHTAFEHNFGEGWNYWQTHSPYIFDFKTMQQYGYYAGIISALNEYKRLHPLIFQKFTVCKVENHDKLPKDKIPDPEIEDLKRNHDGNTFNAKMPIEQAINHFSSLETDGYISRLDFLKFIKAAFLGFRLEKKIKLNLKGGAKGKVVSLFYRFYNKSVPFEKNSHLRDKYIRLLTDYFLDFDFAKLKNNFRPY